MMGAARNIRPGPLGIAFAVIAASAFLLRLGLYAARGVGVDAPSVLLIFAWIAAAAAVGAIVARMQSTQHAVLVTIMVGWLSALPASALWTTPALWTHRLGSLEATLASLFVVWPALFVGITLLGRRAEGARPRSVARRAYLRSLAFAVASVVAMLSAASAGARVPRWSVIGAAGVAAFVCLVSACIDARILRRLGLSASRGDGSSPHLIDYGVGDEEHRFRIDAPRPTYRDSAIEGTAVARGSIGSARRALVVTLVVELVAMVLPCVTAASALATQHDAAQANQHLARPSNACPPVE